MSPNAITHQAILHISRKSWDSLISLKLGDHYFIQLETISVTKGANTSQKPICPTCNLLISVKKNLNKIAIISAVGDCCTSPRRHGENYKDYFCLLDGDSKEIG
jgi:hypothetical protein